MVPKTSESRLDDRSESVECEVYRHRLAIPVAVIGALSCLGFALVRSWASGFPAWPPELYVVIASALLFLWRFVLAPRVIATSQGVKLVRGLRVPVTIPWANVTEFGINSEGTGSTALKAFVVERASGRRYRLPGINAGSDRDRDYVRTTIAALSAALLAASDS